MNRRRSNAGFTLFELVVVLAIMGVVSTIGVSAFFNITGAWRKSTYRLDLGAGAEAVLAKVGADVARVASSKRTGFAVIGVDFLNEEVRYDDQIRLEDDRLVLPILQKDANGRTERVSIQYHVNRVDGPFVMTRTYGALGSAAPDGAREEIVSGVLTFDVQYLEGDAWEKSWSKPYNPDAIRVSVTVRGASPRTYEQISRTAIFPIHAK